MLIFYLAVLLIPMITIKKRKENDKPILDAFSTTSLKGLICIYVKLHNIGLDYEANTPIVDVICEHTGGIGVGIFFFLSAFGIIKSYQTKGNKYLGKIILINCTRLYLISLVINLLIYFVYHQGQLETTDMLLKIFSLDVFNGGNRMNRHGWYIVTIIPLYMLFALIYFICSKLKTKNKYYIAGWILALVPYCFEVITWCVGTGGTYTREIMCFSIGCIYAMYYDKINYIFNKYFIIGLIILTIGLAIGMFTWEPIGAYSACLLIILLSQKITYNNNVLHFLGKICIYLYLFVHFTQLGLQMFRENQYWWTLMNLGLGLLLSLLMYLVEYLITIGIKKLKDLVKINKNKLIKN